MPFDKAKFFDAVRSGLLGPTLSDDEVTGCEAILNAMEGTPISWCAYALATSYLETAHTMQPVREYGGRAYYTRMYDITGQRPLLAKANGNIHPGDGVRYCGRGYVQLTWRNNYRRLGDALGVPLEDQPDLAMQPDIAARIMRDGMEKGRFTGKAFEHFLSPGAAQRPMFVEARRIINGRDRAGLIADYALRFQSALQAGGWA